MDNGFDSYIGMKLIIISVLVVTIIMVLGPISCSYKEISQYRVFITEKDYKRKEREIAFVSLLTFLILTFFFLTKSRSLLEKISLSTTVIVIVVNIYFLCYFFNATSLLEKKTDIFVNENTLYYIKNFYNKLSHKERKLFKETYLDELIESNWFYLNMKHDNLKKEYKREVFDRLLGKVVEYIKEKDEEEKKLQKDKEITERLAEEELVKMAIKNIEKRE